MEEKKENLLVTITHEEIRIQGFQIESHVSDSMGAVNQTQNPLLPTHLRDALERESDPRHADHGVEDGDFDLAAAARDVVDLGGESGYEPVVFDGERVFYFGSLCGRCFGDVGDGFLAGAVDGGAVEDVFIGGEGEVAEDGVDACGGVWDEDEFRGGDVEVLLPIVRLLSRFL